MATCSANGMVQVGQGMCKKPGVSYPTRVLATLIHGPPEESVYHIWYIRLYRVKMGLN